MDHNFNHTTGNPGSLLEFFREEQDAFGNRIAQITANRIDASGEYNFNTGRHRFLENGAFTFDADDTTALDDQQAKMQVTAQPGDEHVFGARENVRYVPNYELLWGIAMWAESELAPGQHMAAEFMQATGTEGYRAHYEGTSVGELVDITLEQYQNGIVVDSFEVEVDHLTMNGFSHTQPHVNRGKVNWYGAGHWKHEISHPYRSPDNGNILDQFNRVVGFTANDDDVATNRINLNVQGRVWAEADADPVTVNICSVGALIRGNATEIDREKPAVFWDIGGSISQYPTDNVSDAMAARIDPNRPEVVVKLQPPLFEPRGTDVSMELSVYAVQKDHPDITANFDDPDDDGTDEGPSPAAQGKAQTDVMQYTRSVSSIPTATDIRADGTTGLVPDMRHLTSTMGFSGGGNSPGSTSGGELAGIKRNIYEDDIVVYLWRTNPSENTTSGVVDWFKPLTEQDF